MVWWLIPIAATLVAAIWVSRASRERRDTSDQLTDEQLRRLNRAMTNRPPVDLRTGSSAQAGAKTTSRSDH